MATWGEVSKDIEPYYYESYWWDGTEWIPMIPSTEMVDGNDYFVNISQACTLIWNDYHFDFVEGRNYFTWEPSDIIATIPLTLTIPSTEDIVATIPLTLTVSSITPPEPPEKDWLDWIKKHSIELGIGGLGVAGVILAWPKRGKR